MKSECWKAAHRVDVGVRINLQVIVWGVSKESKAWVEHLSAQQVQPLPVVDFKESN